MDIKGSKLFELTNYYIFYDKVEYEKICRELCKPKEDKECNLNSQVAEQEETFALMKNI